MTEQSAQDPDVAPVDTSGADTGGPTVGSADAEADRVRSGASGGDTLADADAGRDTDPTPVGSDDADEDARRSGADA